MPSDKNEIKSKLKIKICGMRDQQNIESLVQLPVDYIGFIFYPPSPRYIGDNPDKNIFKVVPSSIKKVGVFVNAPLNEVLRNAEDFGLNTIQLHGSEIADYCNAIRERGYEVIKAFKAEPVQLTCEATAYRYACDYLLFDTPTPKHGGSGKKFDWEMLKIQKLYLPYFLSGGIAPGDASNIKSLGLKGLYAVDVNSRFEIKPGLKDIALIKKFVFELSN